MRRTSTERMRAVAAVNATKQKRRRQWRDEAAAMRFAPLLAQLVRVKLQ